MTEEAKRIAIAKACGWEWKRSDQTVVCEWHNPSGNVGGFIPNHFHDLNAMHEAEGTLTELEFGNYHDILLNQIMSAKFISATATQRAEAFGKVKGLWE